MVYQWKPGTRWKSDPQAAGQRIADLIEENDGTITPAIIVEDARPATSPLHDDFEWDDNVAAKEWREHTARMMVSSIIFVQEIVEEGSGQGTPEDAGRPLEKKASKERPLLPIRAFVNVKQEERRGYTTTARAISDSDLFDQIIDDIIRSIKSYQSKLAAFRQYEQLEVAFVEFSNTLRAIKG